MHRQLRRSEVCPGIEGCVDTGDEFYCAGCLIPKLDEWLQLPLGRAVMSVIEMDFALQMHLPCKLNYYQFGLLRILQEEKNAYQKEQIDKDVAARKGGMTNG